MKPNIFSLVLMLSTIFVQTNTAQIIWLEGNTTSDHTQLIEHQSNQTFVMGSSAKLINYNPGFYLDHSQIAISLGESTMTQCNVFTVFQPKYNSTEGLIWSMQSGGADRLLYTDERVADLEAGKFLNFVQKNLTTAQLNSYHHYKQSRNSNTFHIGGLPKNSDIPVSTYEGVLSEIIVFDHILPPRAKQALESALAIKYSIPLAQNMDYTTEDGTLIWDATKNINYNDNIAGLGKASHFRLNQKQSKSLFGSGYLAFGVGGIANSNYNNFSLLEEESFLVWGDNGGHLIFEKKNGIPETLQKQWLIQNHNFTTELPLSFAFHHDALADELEGGLHYWLKMGEEYYQLEEEGGVFTEENIAVPNVGKTYFSIIKAPSMWAALELGKANCKDGEHGSVAMQLLGGDGPFDLTLYHEQKELEQSNTSQRSVQFSDLRAGNYTLMAEDSKGAKWGTKFSIEHHDLPSLSLNNTYHTFAEDPQVLDLTDKISGTSVTITKPNLLTSTNPIIVLDQSGLYTIEISNDHCTNTYNFEVEKEEQYIQSFEISPNPTNGYFTIDASLQEVSGFFISIRNATGQLIKQNTFAPSKYITISDQLLSSGVYYVTLQSAGSHQTKKLIVIQN